jgi:hypothetical protein
LRLHERAEQVDGDAAERYRYALAQELPAGCSSKPPNRNAVRRGAGGRFRSPRDRSMGEC